MSYFHRHWRDLDEWRRQGLPFSTTSNEAVKLYDVVLTQITTTYDVAGNGPIGISLKKMLDADPNFVMGQVLLTGFKLQSAGTGSHLSQDLKYCVDNLSGLVAANEITNRERLHVRALQEWAHGNAVGACCKWEQILRSHPTDMLAIKQLHERYLALGQSEQLRDSIAQVITRWDPQLPLFSYLHGMYAFGLAETGYYHEAEKHAIKGLYLNPKDSWATHARAHVFEETGQQDKGIYFLKETDNDWSDGQHLHNKNDWIAPSHKNTRTQNGPSSCEVTPDWALGNAGHIFWHWALYHIEKGEYKAALNIYDNELGPRCRKLGGRSDFRNASSLLYRLHLAGVNVGKRWQEPALLMQNHENDHVPFNEVHCMMCLLNADGSEKTHDFMRSLREDARYGEGADCDVLRAIGLTICEALEKADKGRFDVAVQLVTPNRHRIVQLGGSNAQRDIFNLFLINAALRSSCNDHHKLAQSIIAERNALRERSHMTDRLINQVKLIG